MKNTDNKPKCYATGCKNTATVVVTPKFDAPVMHMCDKCKPQVSVTPLGIPSFYDIKPMVNA